MLTVKEKELIDLMTNELLKWRDEPDEFELPNVHKEDESNKDYKYPDKIIVERVNIAHIRSAINETSESYSKEFIFALFFSMRGIANYSSGSAAEYGKNWKDPNKSLEEKKRERENEGFVARIGSRKGGEKSQKQLEPLHDEARKIWDSWPEKHKRGQQSSFVHFILEKVSKALDSETSDSDSKASKKYGSERTLYNWLAKWKKEST